MHELSGETERKTIFIVAKYAAMDSSVNRLDCRYYQTLSFLSCSFQRIGQFLFVQNSKIQLRIRGKISVADLRGWPRCQDVKRLYDMAHNLR